MDEPLSGRHVLVTRSAQQAPALVKLIEEKGGTATSLPLIRTVRLLELWQNEVKKLQRYTYDWIVFTSVNAVRFFKEALLESNMTLPQHVRIAAIGTKTMRELASCGWHPEVIPNTFVAEDLAETLRRKIQVDDVVLFPKSQLARDVLAPALREAGAEVLEMPLYTSVPDEAHKSQLQTLLKQEDIDFLTFTSPSIVQAFVDFVDGKLPGGLWKDIPAVCIGPVTEKEARRCGFHHCITASPYTIEGLLTALIKSLKEDYYE
ncbi:uroporphyrinogen-III synthase [Bacillus piscicola]|uniref:uroporphyrinogen-III synthase n=1 Tax=Bacillus piscicola TaxID=1632684 RepID=UPI001F09FEC7|nr:uroporphyrinogen-III synthase [Bacillus piscicola]